MRACIRIYVRVKARSRKRQRERRGKGEKKRVENWARSVYYLSLSLPQVARKTVASR